MQHQIIYIHLFILGVFVFTAGSSEASKEERHRHKPHSRHFKASHEQKDLHIKVDIHKPGLGSKQPTKGDLFEGEHKVSFPGHGTCPGTHQVTREGKGTWTFKCADGFSGQGTYTHDVASNITKGEGTTSDGKPISFEEKF